MTSDNFISKDVFEIRRLAKEKIITSINELLENKHLYQNIHVDFDEIESKIHDVRVPKLPPLPSKGGGTERGKIASQSIRAKAKQEELFCELNNFKHNYWYFKYEIHPSKEGVIVRETNSPPTNKDFIVIQLPHINIVCGVCKGYRLPHNPGFIGQQFNFMSIDYEPTDPGFKSPRNSSSREVLQTLFLTYQCQKCKMEPVVFMIRRKGLKLQLVGRNHIEEVEVPGYLPYQERNYYKSAAIAFNTGNPLGGLFYLRTFIEQYMRRITNHQKEKIMGEKLGDDYAALLPDDFPTKFKSLKKIYEDISLPLHEGKEDSDQFKQSRDDILKHFEILEHFPIEKKPSPKRPKRIKT